MAHQVKFTLSILPGLIFCLAVAALGWLVAAMIGGPALLYALLAGTALHPVVARVPSGYDPASGIDFSARQVLRFGVALLGLRITLSDILLLGWRPVAIVLVVVPVTIAGGIWLARQLKLSRQFGILSGGATGICGVSAAMAISAVLPERDQSQRWLIATVVGVTTLSTVAMVAYPAICQVVGFDPRSAGFFLGGSIHDVAQVVGAGYVLGPVSGDTATFTKLLRVAMLLPVVVGISLWVAHRGYRQQASTEEQKRPPLLPGFLVGFLVLVLINSTGVIPDQPRQWLVDVSGWCLLISIAAIGIKTALGELAGLGWRVLALMVGETVLIGVTALLLTLAVG